MGEWLLRCDWFLGLFVQEFFVLLLELLDAARGVDELHLAGEERMTLRADFDRDVLLRAARLELVAATALDGGFFVFGVDVFFHGSLRVGDNTPQLHYRDAAAKATRSHRVLHG